MIFSSVIVLTVNFSLLLLIFGTFLHVRADEDGEWFASSIYKPAKSSKDSGGLNSWLSGADYDSAANEPAAPAVETYNYPPQLQNIFGGQQNNQQQQYAGQGVQGSQGGQQYQQQQHPQQQQFQQGQQNPYQNVQQQNAYGGQSQQGHPHIQSNQQHQQQHAQQGNPNQQQGLAGQQANPYQHQGQPGQQANPYQHQGQPGQQANPYQHQGQPGQQPNPYQQQGQPGQQPNPHQQQGPPQNLRPGSPQQPNGQMNHPQPPSPQVAEEPAWKKNDDTNPWLFEQPKEPATWSPEDEKFRQEAFSKMKTKWDYHDEDAEKQRKLQNTQGQVVYEKAYLTKDELMNGGNRIQSGAVINTGGNGQQFFNPEQQQANYQPQGDPMFQPVPKDFYKGKITENPHIKQLLAKSYEIPRRPPPQHPPPPGSWEEGQPRQRQSHRMDDPPGEIIYKNRWFDDDENYDNGGSSHHKQFEKWKACLYSSFIIYMYFHA